MRSSSVSRGVRLALALTVAMAVLGLRTASTQSSGQTDTKGIHYTGTAVSMDAPTGAATTQIDIYIERWSTDAEWKRLMDTMLESGPGKLLDVVQRAPRVGSIRTPRTVGFDLRFARRVPGTNGAERITIITDRPVAFWCDRCNSIHDFSPNFQERRRW